MYVKVALTLLRKPFNLLFSAVPHISACLYTEKGLAITEVLKNYWRKESMTFPGENTSLFFALKKFPNRSIVCFNLIASRNNRAITTYAPMHLSFLPMQKFCRSFLFEWPVLHVERKLRQCLIE